MRVLVVDDEPLARKAMETILAARVDVEHFDSTCDAVEAFEKLAGNAYDVVLLDINMPELSGLELLDRLQECGRPLPSVVFVTAHDQHAIAAFERHAIDYVLKPFSRERIAQALDRAFRRTEEERASRLLNALTHLHKPASQREPRIAIKAKGTVIFVNPADLIAVQAEGNYVLLQRISGSYLLRESISVLEEQLKPYGFIRIHRSVLVNTLFVEEVRPSLTGDYGLRIKGGKEYTVTRTYKKNLRSIAESWIGREPFLAG